LHSVTPSFGIVMDWILKTSRKDRAGIEWLDGEKRSDLDFPDDIPLLEDSWEGMHTTTSALEEETKKFGLVNYVAKTKIMTMGNWKSTGKINTWAAPSATKGVVTGRFWYN